MTVSSATELPATTRPQPLWQGDFSVPDWQRQWRIRKGGSWGLAELERLADPADRDRAFLRAHYPKGSASSTVARATGAPLGGAQFYADLALEPQDSLHLRYHVRFAEGFDFVKGGKLPGLFGGIVHSGGRIPDGTNGFSTRYMWRTGGNGEVYSYLPTSQEFGTSLGRGNWRFEAGRWYRLEQEVVLNTPGRADGRISVWVDGQMVLDERDLLFRTIPGLKIEGIFFSTFFGGDDPSWATPHDTYADFADFAVDRRYIGERPR